MAYSLNLGKLISDITGPKGLAALTEEIHKLRAEVDRLKNKAQPEAEKRLKAIQVRLNGLRNTWEKRQNKFEKEIGKTLNTVRKVAKEAEGKIQTAIRSGKKRSSKKAAKTGSTRTKKTARSSRKRR